MQRKIAEFLKLLQTKKLKYAVIGGIAMLLYGGRASTMDLDLYLSVKDLNQLKKILLKKKIKFTEIANDQIKINLKGLTIDVLTPDPIISKSLFKRVHKVKFENQTVSVASPEDIIVMKTIVGRPLDLRDIAELHEIFGTKINKSFISKTLAEYSKLK